MWIIGQNVHFLSFTTGELYFLFIYLYNISLNATLQLDILALELKRMYQRLKTIT